MNKQQNSTFSPIKLLEKYRQHAPQSSKDLIHERIIYMALFMAESGNPNQQINVSRQIINFIEKMNVKVVGSKDLGFDQRINLIGKCFDMLAIKNIRSLIYPFQKQLQLRALCLNNLSVVYKQNNQLQDSLKAINQALNIEQILLQKQYPGVITSISSTYINRSVILSSLNNHQQAAQTLTKSLQYLNQFLQSNLQKLSKKEVKDLQYTKMFAHFNLAVEYQHLGLSKLASQHFEIAYKQAKQLGDWQLRDKVVQALKSLRNK